MFLLYLSITLIIISGFLPSGELSGLFRLSSWITLIIIIIFNNLKISNNTFKRKLSLLIIIFSFGFVLYIYPYLNFYNWDQLQSLLKNVFNIFLYIISGYEFINIFHLKVNSIVADSNLTLIKRYKKISGLRLLNTVISFCLLLLFPYLFKLILFSKHFIYVFS